MIMPSKRLLLCLPALLVANLGGCLDPQVGDELGPRGFVLPAGTEVPSAHDDPYINQQIADNDGVDGIVPLLSGFADGAPTHYWDFGPSPSFAAPLFALVEKNAEGELELLPHKTIIDAIPGDPGYSPYWSVLFLEVTDLYNGELITSFSAIEEAQERGLLLAPTLPTFAVNCPAVATGVTLDVGLGPSEFLPPPSEFFWQGKTVRYYDLGIMPIVDGTIARESAVLVVAREGKEPLSEPLRSVDMTNDGDALDTNNVFETNRESEDYSPLTRRIDIVLVDDGSLLIDSTENQTESDLKTFTDIFAPEPVPGKLVAFDRTDELRNLPQQSAPGNL